MTDFFGKLKYFTLGIFLLLCFSFSLGKHALATRVVEASMKGELDLLISLLEQGENVNQTDTTGRTALHFAALFGYTPYVNKLIEAGAALDQQDLDGFTALHLAAIMGQSLVVNRLIEVGADLHRQDHEGKTALYFATFYGQTDIVDLLENCKHPVWIKASI